LKSIMVQPIRKELRDSDRTLKETFSSIQSTLPDNGVTMSMVMEFFGKEGFLILSVFLTLPFLVPVSIPGVSTVFGAIILFIGISLMLGQSPRLPERFMGHMFPTDKLRTCLSQGLVWIQRLEKISHRRLCLLCHGHLMSRVNGAAVALSALLLMAPLGLIPFSNTFPGLSILLLSIGILQRDGILILSGYLFLVVTSLYFTLIAMVGATAINMAKSMISGWLW